MTKPEQEKRMWCYIQPPPMFGIKCDKCGGENITWSEWQGLIWCFDCEIDTVGTKGIFDSPIPKQMAELLGISFDRVTLTI